ncbi:MAG: hypothetical protein J5680_06270, partial [Neisseriaceae bacterium]|nr:hypothetical protein [Neisseriaceae bacterium]
WVENPPYCVSGSPKNAWATSCPPYRTPAREVLSGSLKFKPCHCEPCVTHGVAIQFLPQVKTQRQRRCNGILHKPFQAA